MQYIFKNINKEFLILKKKTTNLWNEYCTNDSYPLWLAWKLFVLPYKHAYKKSKQALSYIAFHIFRGYN